MPLLDRFLRPCSGPLRAPDFRIDWAGSNLVTTIDCMSRLGLTGEPDAIHTLGERIINSCTSWLSLTLQERPSDPSRWPLFVMSSEGWQASILPRKSDDDKPRFAVHVAVDPSALMRALDDLSIRPRPSSGGATPAATACSACVRAARLGSGPGTPLGDPIP